MQLGFVGTGTITTAIIDGLIKADPFWAEIVVSPRNAQTSQRLSARYGSVRIAANNQEVLDSCEMVLVAVRPQVVAEVLRGLAFREDHQVVSLVATLGMDRLKPQVAPARSVTRAAPLPPVADRQGATAVFPRNTAVSALFDRLGAAIVASTEEEFDALFTATAVMGSYFELLHATVSWLTEHGVAAPLAKAYMAQMFYGLGAVARAEHSREMSDLRAEFSTRGGLNEQFYQTLRESGTFASVARAMDVIAARLRK
jgi:pyrroline-5-carboxylate reductase